jgi:hypothetical protein
MDERRRDLILHKRVQRIADEHGCSVAEANTVLGRQGKRQEAGQLPADRRQGDR